MAVIISIALQKGGTGKTTTATSLASILGSKKKKVLLVDMDSQANATSTSGIEDPKYSITDILNGLPVASGVLKATHYDIIASDPYLAKLEAIPSDELPVTLIKDILDRIRGHYDFIIIDTPPLRGNILTLCLNASDYIIIPTEARPFALNGLDALQETIESVREQNKNLQVLGILLVKNNNRAILNRQIVTAMAARADDMGTTLFNTNIREGIAVPESQAMGELLIDYAPKSKPTLDYISFTKEVLQRIRGKDYAK